MDLPNKPAATVRRDGWTPERRAQFLERLAQGGNVSAACARVGLTRPAAYRLRGRDPAFAHAWATAQAEACKVRARSVGTRAIDGIELEVYYRGKLVGTRRRYDTRLLLAHIARLDKFAEANPQAEADAERFDELFARIAGADRLPQQPASGAVPDFALRTVSELYTSPPA